MPETANGPDDALTWDAVDWRACEQSVARLRRRIFTAVRDGDLAKARNLQKMLLRSWSNILVSTRLVTQRNAGRRTAGIDRVVALDGRSIPAVRRPALRWATCRTLTRAFDHDLSIIFWRFLAFARSPSRTAVKILCRSRATFRSWTAQLTASHVRPSSGPFTVSGT